MKDLDHHFLAMFVSRRDGGLFLSQQHYIHAWYFGASWNIQLKDLFYPNDTFAKVSSNGVPVSDAIDYSSLVGTP